jgi:hypothetical protein
MRNLRRFSGPLLVVLIVLGFYWKLLTKQYTWMDHPDMANQVLPWMQFEAVSMQRGEFPMWDPHLFGGQPLIGQIQPGAAYPLNWLLFLWPFKDGYISLFRVQIDWVLGHVLAGLFAYLLCRDLKRSVSASVLGGTAFAVTGIIGSVGWPQKLNGAIWIPLVVMYFLRYLRGEKPLVSAALSGSFLGVSWLGGHHMIPSFTSFMMGGLWLPEIWRKRQAIWKPLFAFGVMAFSVGALQLLPGAEYARYAARFVNAPYAIQWGMYVPYTVHQMNQEHLYPSAVLGIILPYVTVSEVFLGIVLVALAIFGLIHEFRNGEVKRFGVITLGGFLFAMGGYSIFHGVAYLIVPLVEKARSPVMALVIAQFAIVMLAAYGLDALRSRVEWSKWWVPGLIGCGAAALLLLAGFNVARIEASREYERLAVFGYTAIGLAALLHAWRKKLLSERAVVVLIFIAAFFELGAASDQRYVHRDAPVGFLSSITKNKDLADFLRTQPDFIRLEIDNQSLTYNFGDWEGIDGFQGYLASLTANLLPIAGENPTGPSVVQQIYSLTHWAGRNASRPGQTEIFRGKSGIAIYRNQPVFPRAWSVHEAVTGVPKGVLPRLEGIDLKKQTLILGEVPKLEQCDGTDNVRVLNKETRRIVLEAQMACKGMVVLSQTHYPGWYAKVDGVSAPIHEAYTVLQGVVVNSGTHRVEFYYAPWSVYVGGLLTVLGLLGTVALVVVRRAGK